MRIYHDISDREIDTAYVDGLKCRELSQKFLYLKDWASCYYNTMEWFEEFLAKNRESILWLSWVFKSADDFLLPKSSYTNKSHYKDFISAYIHDFSEKTLLVSLGCGNASPEKSILEWLSEEKKSYDSWGIDYIWVDYSWDMLDLAREQLKGIDLKKDFIRADITSDSFKKYIKNTIQENWYTEVYYAFLWASFWNFSPTIIAEDFRNLMTDKDWLRFDVKQKPNVNDTAIMRYNKRLHNDELVDFIMWPLQSVWVSLNEGDMKLVYGLEQELNALHFRFIYEPRWTIEFTHRTRNYRFVKWEDISLLDIYVHDTEWLTSFMKKHWFLLFDSVENSFKGEVINDMQFLYKLHG